MLISLVTFVPIIFLFNSIETTLLEPARKCVPTTSVRGPCHVCVCTSEGIFNCRPRVCQEDETLGSKTPKEDCEPNYLYRQDNQFCTCSDSGFWESQNCEELFHYLLGKKKEIRSLRTSVPCKPNEFFLVDCNLCQCSPNGVIDVTLCTNRYCDVGHKVDNCAYGDILRTKNELCTCSDINYYIDRLCIKIANVPIQIIPTQEMMKLDLGEPWRCGPGQKEFCNTDAEYQVNCNKCFCKDDQLLCKTTICQHKHRDEGADKTNEIESLPVLKSLDGVVCQPGMKYRYRCNVCSCTHRGVPSCTMIPCLEDS